MQCRKTGLPRIRFRAVGRAGVAVLLRRVYNFSARKNRRKAEKKGLYCMDTSIEIGAGAVFVLPPPDRREACMSDPLFWKKAVPFGNAEKTYRDLASKGYPLLFHVWAENPAAASAEAAAFRRVLGHCAENVRIEGGVAPRKIPFGAFCCVDDSVVYLSESDSEMKAVIDRPFNSEIACLEYRDAVRQMYRLTEPAQMAQLAKFMGERAAAFVR